MSSRSITFFSEEHGRDARATGQQLGRHARATRRGFTLIEVLVAGVLIAVVLPVLMRGIDLCGAASSSARRRDVAAGLAQAKLSELVATNQWQSGKLSGDFNPDWPEYRWEGSLQPQQTSTFQATTSAGTVQELNLQVIWRARNRDDSVTLTTLVYQRSSSQ